MSIHLFLSYARSDDEPFVARLYAALKAAGFDIWFDRVSMPSRQLTFHQEIRDAVTVCDRLILVVGPNVVKSDYVTQEWRFAYFEAVKCVNPIVRLDGLDAAGKKIDAYSLIPEDLRLIHAEDFRDDAQFDAHLANLIRQLSDPLPPAGKLVAVPELPPHYLDQPARLAALRDILLADLQKPVVVSGAAARVGLQGMGGIGKSVLASALAHRPEVRRSFPDGVYWVTLGQEPNVADLQRGLARALGDDGLFTGVDAGKEKLRELLGGRAALLVLDDVWQRGHAEAFNVLGPRGRLLLTTRDAGLVTALAAKENHYQVQLPTEEEAEALLAKAAGVPIQELSAEARQVVHECGRLPLGLALCGGMVQGGRAWQDVLEALLEHDLEYLSDSHPAEEQHRSIWKAMDVSIRALPEDERERFAELAVFALDTDAPEAAVETLWGHTAGFTPRRARDLLMNFRQRSLIDFDQTTRRMTLHDLLHNFATGMAAKRFGSTVALHGRLLEAYRKACPVGWPSGPNDGYFLQNLVGHLLAAGETEDAVALLTNVPWIEAKCAAGLVMDLGADYDAVLAERPRESLRLLHAALMLSLPVLVRDPKQLRTQLFGRLGNKQSALKEFLHDLDRTANAPWLYPRIATLTAPDEGIRCSWRALKRGECARLRVSSSERILAVITHEGCSFWDVRSGSRVDTNEGGAHFTDFAYTALLAGVPEANAETLIAEGKWQYEARAGDKVLQCRVQRESGYPYNNPRYFGGTRLVDRISAWDLGTVTAIEGTYALTQGALCGDISADGRTVICGGVRGAIVVYSVDTRSVEAQGFLGNETLVAVCKFPHSSSVAALTLGGMILVGDLDWKKRTDVALIRDCGELQGLWLRDSGTRAIVMDHETNLTLWDTDSGELLFRDRATEGRLSSCRFTPDLRFAFVQGVNQDVYDGHVIAIYDLTEKRCVFREEASKKRLWAVRVFRHQSEFFAEVANEDYDRNIVKQVIKLGAGSPSGAEAAMPPETEVALLIRTTPALLRILDYRESESAESAMPGSEPIRLIETTPVNDVFRLLAMTSPRAPNENEVALTVNGVPAFPSDIFSAITADRLSLHLPIGGPVGPQILTFTADSAIRLAATTLDGSFVALACESGQLHFLDLRQPISVRMGVNTEGVISPIDVRNQS